MKIPINDSKLHHSNNRKGTYKLKPKYYREKEKK